MSEGDGRSKDDKSRKKLYGARMRTEGCHRKAIQESLRAFLRSAQCSTKIGVCERCGATAELQKATVFFWETDETVEVTLPVCRECVSSMGTRRTPPTTERSCIQ